MGVSTRKAWGIGLGVMLVAATFCSGAARSATALQVGSDAPGSIVVFPKVISNGFRDTVITLTNTSNQYLFVHCWYVNTLCPADESCCKEDFDVELTPRQPTWWRVSEGRNIDSGRGKSAPGFFFTNIAPQPNFEGELKCIEVEDSGTPIVRNALKGEAVLESLVCGDGVTEPSPSVCEGGSVSAYNGIAFEGGDGPVSTCLGGPENTKSCLGTSSTTTQTTPALCAAGGGVCRTQLLLDGKQYAACPNSLHVTHYAQGAKDFADESTVTGELTLVPCTENFNEIPLPDPPGDLGRVVAQLRAHDEFESEPLSYSVPFSCWYNFSLGETEAYRASFIGPYVKTRVLPGAANGAGLLAVFEEFHAPAVWTKEPVVPVIGTAAVNTHSVGSRENCTGSGAGKTCVPRDAITMEDLGPK